MLKRILDINSELLNLITLLIGILLTLIALFLKRDTQEDVRAILISIGTSIVASSIVIFLSSRYLIKESKTIEMVDTWKLNGIYLSRAEMNQNTNVCLRKCRKKLDIVAFGLKSFRETQSRLIEEKVKSGLKIRILTIDPQSRFISQREKDEGEVIGQISNTIIQLSTWINNLKTLAPDPKNVQIKYYDTLPLDFYFRVDDHLFLGPYMYGRSSQQTFSYEFKYGGLGFQYWTTYFEELWLNIDLSKSKP